jgi:hypothetical protein
VRKHSEVIRAWLDGKTIQCKGNNIFDWEDMNTASPISSPHLQWRIKSDVKQEVFEYWLETNYTNHLCPKRINDINHAFIGGWTECISAIQAGDLKI